MKVKHVLECQFHKWYAQWSKQSIESEIIPLPKDFVEWLDDGKFIANAVRSTIEEYEDPDSAFSQQELEQLETAPSQDLFPELCKQIEEQIAQLGGAVVPKLNWSSPKDAVWMNWTGNMKCEDADQILLLLKSSDCITHDLTEPFDHCEDKHTNLANVEYYLVLRKWKSIHPASEFRCFVSHDKLIGQFSSPLSPNSPLISRTTGVTQRYHDQYFQYLHDFVPRITKQLEEFFAKKMKGLFPSHTYVFDVYIENMSKRDSSVVLLDLNPFGRVTDSMLFAWEELFLLHFALEQQPDGEHSPLDFRYVSQPIHIQPSLSTSNAKPVDYLDVSSQDGLLELIRLQRQQESDNS